MASDTYPQLQTKNIKLFPLAIAKPERVLSYYERNKEHLMPWEPKKSREFYSLDYWEHRIALAAREFQTNSGYAFVIEPHHESSLIMGIVNFSQVFHGAFCACYLGFSLDVSSLGKGIMTEALDLAIPYVFEKKNIHRIMANYLPENKASARLLQKLGFKIEGQAEDYLRINGAWRDHILTSLTNPNWQEP